MHIQAPEFLGQTSKLVSWNNLLQEVGLMMNSTTWKRGHIVLVKFQIKPFSTTSSQFRKQIQPDLFEVLKKSIQFDLYGLTQASYHMWIYYCNFIKFDFRLMCRSSKQDADVVSEKGQSFEKIPKVGSKHKSGSASGQLGSKEGHQKAGSGVSAFKVSLAAPSAILWLDQLLLPWTEVAASCYAIYVWRSVHLQFDKISARRDEAGFVSFQQICVDVHAQSPHKTLQEIVISILTRQIWHCQAHMILRQSNPCLSCIEFTGLVSVYIFHSQTQAESLESMTALVTFKSQERGSTSLWELTCRVFASH